MTEKKAMCPSCDSVWFDVENVHNKDGQGIIQAKCNDCGQKFEMFVERTKNGWTQFELD